MHDFLIAKDIINEVVNTIIKKGLKGVSCVELEIGSIAVAHDDLPEHAEDVNLENLEFGLQSIAKDTILEGVDFSVEKVDGDSWKIKNIVVK